MSDLIYDTYIFPTVDTCLDADITQLHPNNQILYGQWLHKLKKGRTWFGLHWDWPDLNFKGIIPDDCDTYVFSWHLENWDHDWLDKFCQSHPNQQVIAIGEFQEKSQHPNLKILVFHCWDLLISYVLETFGNNHEFKEPKKYLVSSLCNKPSFTKTLITAYLIKNYYPHDQLLVSWNINKRGEQCRSMQFLDTTAMSNRDSLTDLCQYYHSAMKDFKITIDDFVDVPWNHFDFAHPAFTDSLINLTNETFAQSQKFSRIYPGPYFSEKTWKPLLAGSAVLPVGQPNVYRYLENFGLCMDYPWPREFDTTVGDLDRIEKTFDAIDWIMKASQQDDQNQIMEVNRYNYHYIRSKEFLSTIKSINAEALEKFLESY